MEEGSDPFGEKVNILPNIAMRLGRKVIDRQKKMYISINQFCGGLRGLARGGAGSAAKAQESIVFTGVLRGLRGLSRRIEKLSIGLTALRGFFRG